MLRLIIPADTEQMNLINKLATLRVKKVQQTGSLSPHTAARLKLI